jgi:hypothetical protein
MKYKAPESFDGTGLFVGGGWVSLSADRTVTVPNGDHSGLEAAGFTAVTPKPRPKAAQTTDLPHASPTK